MARDQWQVWLDGGDGDPFGVGPRHQPRRDPDEDGDDARDREREEREEIDRIYRDEPAEGSSH